MSTSDEMQDTQYDETDAIAKPRYTETITAGEDDTSEQVDGGTVIDPDGNVQAHLEDDGA